MRYLSDASYWLYLPHLPLVIGAQMLLVTWPINIHLKFLLISTTIVAGLLFVYQVGVCYTVIGTVMNGPRIRRTTTPAQTAEPMVPRPHAGARGQRRQAPSRAFGSKRGRPLSYW